MTYLIGLGDARRIPLADGSVHCVVTSPPYFGLRDYGTKGQIGLEETPDAYVAEMVAVFREVQRVLRDDGTCWLNLGDSYATGAGKVGERPGGGVQGDNWKGATTSPNRMPLPGLKPKDLIGIPWRVAFALQSDGWYLRQDIIWAKPNPMPESVTDRCTKAHEYVFLLTKRPRYYYDAEAVKEASAYSGPPKPGKQAQTAYTGLAVHSGQLGTSLDSRNLRSVWSIATTPYPGAHFATMPPELARRCIRAGTSARGCCPACGAPWVRVVEKDRVPTRPGVGSKVHGLDADVIGNRDPQRHVKRGETWAPSCQCPDAPPVPCVVFDPFNGAGTTGMVATQEGRRYVGFDLSPDYITQARRRIADGLRPVSRLDGPTTAEPLPGQLNLF